jgi:2-oxoglutarate ferredoxin oxidoreductase subunit delta
LALSSAFNAKGYHPPNLVHPEKCSGCDLCGMYCPDFAIFGFKNEGEKAATAKTAEPQAVAPVPTETEEEAQDAR